MFTAATGTAADHLIHHQQWRWPPVHQWPALTAAMIVDPRQPEEWPYLADTAPTTAATAIAAVLLVVQLATVVAGCAASRRRHHRAGTATAKQLQPLQARAIIRSAGITRPTTVLPHRSVRRARRIGLHQYGPAIGTLHGPGRPELRCRHEDSAIAIAPPRGYKTTAIGVPRVLDAPGPLVCTSTKADLLLVTATRRAQTGRILVLDGEGIADPLHPDWQALRWDPLDGCHDPDVAIRRATTLVGARPLGSVRNGDFFSGQASDILRCWLMAARLGGYRIDHLTRWLHTLSDPTPADLLDTTRADWASRLRGLATNTAGEMVGGIVGTLQLILSPLDSPRILHACTPPADGHRFDIAQFLDSTDTLYLLTEGDVNGAGPFVTALVDEIVHHARRASQHRPSGRLDPPLSMVLDEPGNTAATPHLPIYMSDSGGRGITMQLLPQGWGQMRRRWGHEGAQEIFNSATLALIMGGGKESDFLEDISRLVGQRQVRHKSTTRGAGRRSTQYSDREERTLPIGDLRTIPDGQALMLYQRLPPAIVDLPTWYRGPHARQITADIQALASARRTQAINDPVHR